MELSSWLGPNIPLHWKPKKGYTGDGSSSPFHFHVTKDAHLLLDLYAVDSQGDLYN